MKTKNLQKRRAFGYARCSHVSQLDGETLTVQHERIKALCTLHGYELVEIFTDEGVSGGTAFRSRPAGARLWEALQAGDTIIALKLDRAFRNIADATATLQACQDEGYGLILADLGSEDVCRGSVASLVFNLLASVSSFERQRCGERIRDVKDSQRARGEFLGGLCVPFGYQIAVRDGVRVLEANVGLQERVLDLHRREFTSRMIVAELKVRDGVAVSAVTLCRFLRGHALAA